jgi:UDP-N-acetylglucosamine 2-epimerase (non-hydrolysing)
MLSPWPEEANRKLTSVLTSIHFAPTKKSAQNLLDEGYNTSLIKITGNTVIDSLYYIISKIERNKNIEFEIINSLPFYNSNKKFILITGHRRESFGKGFEKICNAIAIAALKHQNFDFIYPVHLNPNVTEPVNRILKNVKNVHLVTPLSYLQFVFLMKKSYFILTDSGGIQEEAPSLGKPVLVMREITERPEALLEGTVKLVGTDIDKITENIDKLINDKNVYLKMSNAVNPYGDGDACSKIIDELYLWHLSNVNK